MAEMSPDDRPEDGIIVVPVVVSTCTFRARPSSMPDAEAFIRDNVPSNAIDRAELKAIYAAIREALFAAAHPDIGSFQVTVRAFPDDVEVEILSNAEPATRNTLPARLSRGSFSDWLAASLRHQGLSQEAAARKLGVSVRTINRWVHGHSEPRYRDLRRVEEMLGRDHPAPP